MNKDYYSRNIIALDLAVGLENHPSPFIKIYDNTLSAALCDKLVQFYEDNKQYAERLKTSRDQHDEARWKEQGIDKQSITKRDSWGLTIDNLMKEDLVEEANSVYKIIYNCFDTGIKKYLKMIGRTGCSMVYAIKCFKDEKYFITKYQKGEGFYKWHVDRGLLPITAISNSYISVIVYLNDVEIGGETEFLEGRFKVKAKKGRLLIFPSGWTYIHRGIMPMSGDKYICNNFFSLTGR